LYFSVVETVTESWFYCDENPKSIMSSGSCLDVDGQAGPKSTGP